MEGVTDFSKSSFLLFFDNQVYTSLYASRLSPRGLAVAVAHIPDMIPYLNLNIHLKLNIRS